MHSLNDSENITLDIEKIDDSYIEDAMIIFFEEEEVCVSLNTISIE